MQYLISNPGRYYPEPEQETREMVAEGTAGLTATIVGVTPVPAGDLTCGHTLQDNPIPVVRFP